MKRIAAVGGAVLAAIAASACCILPALLGAGAAGSLGFGAALGSYRPYLLTLTLLLLGLAFYLTYRSGRNAACDDDGCAANRGARVAGFNKAVLWVVTLLTLGIVAYPELAARGAGAGAFSDRSMAPASPTAKTALFTIGEITCASCTVEIADAPRKTPGVQDTKVELANKRASVHYDEQQVSVARLRATVEQLGYEVDDEHRSPRRVR